MSAGKHTPGPWRAELQRYGNGETLFVVGPSGSIAQLVTYPPGREANARLIAAAPELLQALVELVDLKAIKDNNNFSPHHDSALRDDYERRKPLAWAVAHAAIAKATGGAQ